MVHVQLHISEEDHLQDSDPKHHPVLIVGLLENLTRVTYDTLKVKLLPRVSKEVRCSNLVWRWTFDCIPIRKIYFKF